MLPGCFTISYVILPGISGILYIHFHAVYFYFIFIFIISYIRRVKIIVPESVLQDLNPELLGSEMNMLPKSSRPYYLYHYGCKEHFWVRPTYQHHVSYVNLGHLVTFDLVLGRRQLSKWREKLGSV